MRMPHAFRFRPRCLVVGSHSAKSFLRSAFSKLLTLPL
jgi:hypothetical protein